MIVRNNPLLCNVDSIDWDRITVQPATEEVGSHNAIQKSSPEECQNVTGCAHCPERSCWTPKYCQQYETGLNQYGMALDFGWRGGWGGGRGVCESRTHVRTPRMPICECVSLEVIKIN